MYFKASAAYFRDSNAVYYRKDSNNVEKTIKNKEYFIIRNISHTKASIYFMLF